MVVININYKYYKSFKKMATLFLSLLIGKFLKKKKKAGSKARELILEQQLNQSPLRKTTESAKVNFRNVQSHYAYNKPILPPVSKSKIQR